MRELNDFELDAIYNKLNLDLTENQIYRAKELFKKSMKEEINQGISFEEQESMFTFYCIGIANGENEKRMFNHFADNKHTDIVYQIMYEHPEEAEKIFDVIDKLDLPTSILLGLRPFTPYENTMTIPNGKKVHLKVEYEKIGPESLVLKEFLIEIDGKNVYSFAKNINEDKEEINWYEGFTKNAKLGKFENDYLKELYAEKKKLEKGIKPKKDYKVVVKDTQSIRKTTISVKYVGKNKDKAVFYARDEKGRFAKTKF